MKAFVIAYNRLTLLKKLCEDLTKKGCEVIIVDNNSKYAPLLEWYTTCPYRLIFAENTGHKSVWTQGIIDACIGEDTHYIVTDHDLDISGVPDDMIQMLMKGFSDPSTVKSGLSLEIEDLPTNEYTDKVFEIEKRYWMSKTKEGFYSAPIDTTLAVYDVERMKNVTDQTFFNAVRSPKPYSAKHMPWYNTPENITEEEKFYMSQIKNAGFWNYEFMRIYGNN